MRVSLFIYDLSNGLVKQLSLPLLGKQLDGLWHTSIVLHQEGHPVEYFFSSGIQKAPAGEYAQSSLPECTHPLHAGQWAESLTLTLSYMSPQNAGTTPFGSPIEVMELGETEVRRENT